MPSNNATRINQPLCTPQFVPLDTAARNGDTFLYFPCRNTECNRKQKNVHTRYVLNNIYKILEALRFTKEDVIKNQNSLTEYINICHNELVEEKPHINATITILF